MARPGLKPPPRHAVVVRGGDAPISETIPAARSSFPPAPSHEVPPPPSSNDKATLRAIPAAARVPHFSSVVFEPARPSAFSSAPPLAGAALESAPPPSDAPLAQSIPPEHGARPTRRAASVGAILAAAAAGLALGLTSVLATFHRQQAHAPVAAVQAPTVAPPIEEPASETLASPRVLAPTPSAPVPVSSVPAATRTRETPEAAPKPPAPAPKQTIF